MSFQSIYNSEFRNYPNEVSDEELIEESFLRTEQVYNAMSVCDRLMPSYSLTYKFISDPNITNRNFAVEWILRVLEDHNCDIRDTALNIFHSYLISCYEEDSRVLSDSARIAFTAVTSIILSAKLHNSTSNTLNMRLFTAFTFDDIVYFEKLMILKIGHKMSSLVSPSYFLSYFIGLCHGIMVDQEKLMNIAQNIICSFSENPQSLLFSPSTIALTSIILATSMMKVQCNLFIERLPEFFFPNRSFPFFSNQNPEKFHYMDITRCMQQLESLPILRAAPSVSPVNVTNLFS